MTLKYRQGHQKWYEQVSLMDGTIMQSLTFITSMVSENVPKFSTAYTSHWPKNMLIISPTINMLIIYQSHKNRILGMTILMYPETI